MFWLFFFTRFPVLHGWNLKDVMSLWAVTTAGYGIAYGVMGNAHRRLAPAIAQGELDLWMLHPRAVLPHLLLGSTIPSAWGDAAFGYVIYFGFVRPNVQQSLMFAMLSLVVAVVFVGFGIMTGSLSFYLGNASTLSDQWRDISITFATYPADAVRRQSKVSPIYRDSGGIHQLSAGGVSSLDVDHGSTGRRRRSFRSPGRRCHSCSILVFADTNPAISSP